ncbi:MAG TPA: NADH-quinone oxidoreductase subunit C, partial [Chitinophagales bacterium]
MALDNTSIQQGISEKFGDKVTAFEEAEMLAFEADKEIIHELVAFLRDELQFNFLTDVCGIHYPANDKARQFATVYHLHNWLDNVRVRVKTFLDGENPEVETVCDLFLSANW